MPFKTLLFWGSNWLRSLSFQEDECDMPESCENWLGLVNICAYFARQIPEIYYVQPYSVAFNAPWELWNPFGKTVLSKSSSMSYIIPAGQIISILLLIPWIIVLLCYQQPNYW